MPNKKELERRILTACDDVVDAIQIIADALDCLERIGLSGLRADLAREDIIGSLAAAVDSGVSRYKKDIDYNLSHLMDDIENMREVESEEE